MRSLYQVLKASKLNPVSAPDMFTALWAKNISGGGSAPTEHEYTGTVPTTITTDGTPLISWTIYGDMQQSGTPTPDSPIYPSETGDKTANLFNGTFTEGYQLAPNSGLPVAYTNNSRCAIETPINVSNLNTVTFSFKNDTTENKFYMYSLFNGTTLIERVAGKTSGDSIDVSTGTALYLCVYTSLASVNAAKTISEIMLNEGSTALPFEPYGYKLPVQCGGVTTNVYLTAPIRQIGDNVDYKSESAEYRTINKYEFTGQEIFSASGSGFVVTINDAIGVPMTEITKAICSHYQAQRYDRVYSGSWFGFAQRSGSSNRGFAFSKGEYETPQDFQTYLQQQYAAGTPVTVWYVLYTPTTTTVEAPEIPTSDGEQTFDVATELEPSSVYIKYKG